MVCSEVLSLLEKEEKKLGEVGGFGLLLWDEVLDDDG